MVLSAVIIYNNIIRASGILGYAHACVMKGVVNLRRDSWLCACVRNERRGESSPRDYANQGSAVLLCRC